MQLVTSALAFTLDRTGSKRAAMMAMMAITTNNSIKVNPLSFWHCRCIEDRTVDAEFQSSANKYSKSVAGSLRAIERIRKAAEDHRSPGRWRV
jgi:hypothetical protein